LVTDRIQMSLPNVTASAASVAASGAPPGRPAVAMLAIVVAVTAWRLLALLWTGHDLQPDEAQYWLWAQEPAFGYFSKPPMVAWLIGATTAACGDGEACVRLGSPLLHGMAALAIWRLGQEIGGPRLGLWSGTLYLTLPGIGFSSLLVSTDVPLLLCWCVALLALWRLSHGGGVGWAVAGGLAAGAGLLSKYAMAYLLLCAVVWMAIAPAAARRVGIAKAAVMLAIALALLAPNLGWNALNGFPTLRHTAANANLAGPLLHPDRLAAFVGGQALLLGPVLFAALVLRLVRLRRPVGEAQGFLLAFGLPVLAFMLVQSLLSRAHANWAAVSYPALTILVAHWLIELGRTRILVAALALHLAIAAALPALPTLAGDIRVGGGGTLAERLQGWSRLGRSVAAQLAADGQPKLLLADRKGAALLAYYARPASGLRMWEPDGVAGNHFEMTWPLRADETGPLLLVAPAEVAERIASRFTTATPRGRVAPPERPERSSDWRMIRVDGFGGY
jgi:4-amino-4-deoxy-L-arabinose transferase-like glycosyltransferase